MLTLIGARVSAQNVPTITLSKPAQTFAEPFSRVGGVREQSDGRVVVLDRQEIKLVRIDFKTGSATPICRSGKGPGEYTYPLYLAPLPGDSTLAVEMGGGGRNIVITSDGVSGTPLRSTGYSNNKPLFSASDIATDSRGRVYEKVARYRMQNGQLMRLDSGGVRRLDRVTGKQDTLGMISQRLAEPSRKAVAVKPKAVTNDPRPDAAAREQPVFPGFDQWAVAPDGRVAIVTVYPYRVTFFAENGAATIGPEIAVPPIKMSAGFKARWKEMQTEPAPTLTFGPGGMQASGKSVRPYNEPRSWPDELPPFLGDALQFAPDGNLWVERTTPAGVPQTFDVIDRSGKVASRVVLPAKARLVGFGKGCVYVVRIDDDDLERLERHVVG